MSDLKLFKLSSTRSPNSLLLEGDGEVSRVTHQAAPDPTAIAEKGFARDVTSIGHFGTENLERTLASRTDVEKARHRIERS